MVTIKTAHAAVVARNPMFRQVRNSRSLGRNPVALIAKNEGKYPQNGNNNPVGPNGYGPDKPYYPGYITSQGQ